MFSIRTVLVPMDFSACALAALDHAADLARPQRGTILVIGTHGHSGWGHLLLGSMVERIVCRAECPVLTVKDHVVARSLEVEVDAGGEASE